MAACKRCGLSDRKIASALAGTATAAEMAEVRTLAVRSGAVVGVSHAVSDLTLVHTVNAYRRNGRPVIAVTDAPADVAAVRRRLGVTTHTASDLAQQLVPPAHWRCLWAAARHGRGCLVDRLAFAERVRRSNMILPRKCVVVVDAGLDRTAELHTMLKAVRSAGGKLILTGKHSVGIRERMDQQVRQYARPADAKTTSRAHTHKRSTVR